jgi:hypothetical protein
MRAWKSRFEIRESEINREAFSISGQRLLKSGGFKEYARELRLGPEFPTSGFRQTDSCCVLALNWRRLTVQGRRSFRLSPPLAFAELLGLISPEALTLMAAMQSAMQCTHSYGRIILSHRCRVLRG